MMRQVVLISLMLSLLILTVGAAGPGGKKKAKKPAKQKTSAVSYQKQVFPIIQKYCLPCHSEEQMNASELYFENYDEMMAGGKHGKPIVPGHADSSLVILKLSPHPPFGDPMPLRAKIVPTEAEIKLLRDWIDQGAKKN